MNDFVWNRHVVQNTELGIRSRHVIIEEGRWQVKDNSEGSENFEGEFVAFLGDRQYIWWISSQGIIGSQSFQSFEPFRCVMKQGRLAW